MHKTQEKVLQQLFLSAVKAVQPVILVPEYLKKLVNTDKYEYICVGCAGKASAAMAAEAENILRNKITEGLAVVKHGYALSLRPIGLIEARHPVPEMEPMG